MKSFVRASCLAACVCCLGLSLTGCGVEKEGTPVATSEDEIAAYEKLVEGDQAQAAEDEANAGQ